MADKGNNTWLSEIFAELRKESAKAKSSDSKKGKRQKLTIEEVCTRVCGCIMGRLPELKNPIPANQPKAATATTAQKPKSMLVSYFTTLVVISSVCPEAVANHVKDLAPYLKPIAVSEFHRKQVLSRFLGRSRRCGCSSKCGRDNTPRIFIIKDTT